jgi:hypothetical protein
MTAQDFIGRQHLRPVSSMSEAEIARLSEASAKMDNNDRIAGLRAASPHTAARLGKLISLAQRGLPQMRVGMSFVHTVRRAKELDDAPRPEGNSLRYAVNVASGLALVDETTQREILGGHTARDLALHCAKQAETSTDMGAVALAAWAAAEVADAHAVRLFERLSAMLHGSKPLQTVTCAWTLIAALAAQRLGEAEHLDIQAAARLLAGQGRSGLFPHNLPASAGGLLRAHIGCFADQVYSVMGLSRLFAARGNAAALASAEACAAAICAAQGPAGQWWWHYDVRNGSVVEGYPVYSVHQHAMGPMALLDLREAGGTDHMVAVARGLDWLDVHPEVEEPLVSENLGVIWRKVARHEPGKTVRYLSSATTALKQRFILPKFDVLFPPNQIDYECRPYELGWLLYAWFGSGLAVSGAAHNRSASPVNPMGVAK